MSLCVSLCVCMCCLCCAVCVCVRGVCVFYWRFTQDIHWRLNYWPSQKHSSLSQSPSPIHLHQTNHSITSPPPPSPIHPSHQRDQTILLWTAFRPTALTFRFQYSRSYSAERTGHTTISFTLQHSKTNARSEKMVVVQDVKKSEED